MSGRKKKKRKNHLFEDENGGEYSVTDEEIHRAVQYLKEQRKRKNGKSVVKKENCCESRKKHRFGVRNQTTLYCRQLPSVAKELRKAILRQDWKEAVYLTLFLCHPGIIRYSSVIIRSCLMLLFNHPKSNIRLLEKFLRECTGYTSKEDIKKYLKILFVLRDEPLPTLHVGKYIRSNTDFRIIDHEMFTEL